MKSDVKKRSGAESICGPAAKKRQNTGVCSEQQRESVQVSIKLILDVCLWNQLHDLFNAF